jgi:catechol 2,3-dioxygenase-like lactoylglutathione lyase family enzyme
VSPALSAVGVVVSDMDAAIAFYAKLGLDVTVDARRPDHAACDLSNGTPNNVQST